MNETNDEQEDPIVQEVRQAREEIFAGYNYDLGAFLKDMQRRTEEAARAGQKVGSPSSQQARDVSASAKKVG